MVAQFHLSRFLFGDSDTTARILVLLHPSVLPVELRRIWGAGALIAFPVYGFTLYALRSVCT
jgi:hypothetical protein